MIYLQLMPLLVGAFSLFAMVHGLVCKDRKQVVVTTYLFWISVLAWGFVYILRMM